MGAFNTLIAELHCPRCGQAFEDRVQFKYGDTWQFEYRLGDTLRWGGSDFGKPGAKKVVVDGCPENGCPECGLGATAQRPFWDLYVMVLDDVLSAVETTDGRFAFDSERGEYVVVEGPE